MDEAKEKNWQKHEGTLSVEAENLFPILRKWLYSDHDIFVRELVSNATDAIRKRSELKRLGEIESCPEPRIDLVWDKKESVIRFSDNGLGMTREEIERYINQIAFSGAVDFLQKYENAGSGIIGHFGLGFYSSFMMAERVTIDTLSYSKGAEPAFWESEDGVRYRLDRGSRTEPGSTISVYLNEEGREVVSEAFLRQTLRKYCAFMPYPIFLTVVEAQMAESPAPAASPEPGAASESAAEKTETAEKPEEKPVNRTSPLWLKTASECTEEEYKQFYRETFGDYRDPLFWIHLKLDYPFQVQGILYFPQFEAKIVTLDGRIKLYNNQVFVADNIRELIPDFLFLLRGCLDCPDLPLNVSRSFLQQDRTVKKLSEHIVRKVADKLVQLFEQDRERYEKAWKDIGRFVKYGMLQDEKFCDRVQKAVLFPTTEGTWLSWEEAGKELYYTKDAEQQAHAVARVRKQGHSVIRMDDEIDTAWMNLLEYKREGTKFRSVDAAADTDKGAESVLEPLVACFEPVIGKLDYAVAALGSEELPAVLQETEEAQRMRQMEEMLKQLGGAEALGMGPRAEQMRLLLNTDHPLIQKLPGLGEGEKTALVHQIYDLARLGQGSLKGDELVGFLHRSAALLGGEKAPAEWQPPVSPVPEKSEAPSKAEAAEEPRFKIPEDPAPTQEA